MQLLHHLLRDGTQATHARVGARFAITDPALGPDGYRRILAALRGWYAPLEVRLDRASVGVVRLPPTGRTAWLDADLLHLGLPREALALLPACEDLPPLDTPSDVFGCRYVIEGASLGAAVIARDLRRRFGPDGLRFFVGHGRRTAACWRAFLDHLERARAEVPLDDGRTLASAEATFLSLERWLGARGVLR